MGKFFLVVAIVIEISVLCVFELASSTQICFALSYTALFTYFALHDREIYTTI